MTPNLFVGTWKLVSYETLLKNGQVIYPFGEKPIGYLVYTEDGYMSVNMMNTNRPLLSFKRTKKALAVTRTDSVPVIRSGGHFNNFAKSVRKIFYHYFVKLYPKILAYCGKYEVLEDKVVHYPEVSTVPNWIGVRLERTFKMTDSRLFLSPPPSKSSTQSTSQLIWERV